MLKYVRLYHPTEIDRFIFALPPLSHADLAQAYADGGSGYKPLSAGFVDFGPAGNFTTHGESVSLKLKPMPDDAQRIYLLYVNTPIMGTHATARKVSDAEHARRVHDFEAASAQSV